MVESNYFSSLKNKEFRILRKLCENTISHIEREELQKELEEIRLEIKKIE